MSEAEGRAGRSFPEGSIGHDESVKGYELEATDGPSATSRGPEKAVDWTYVDQFERGMLGGGLVWPYTDV